MATTSSGEPDEDHGPAPAVNQLVAKVPTMAPDVARLERLRPLIRDPERPADPPPRRPGNLGVTLVEASPIESLRARRTDRPPTTGAIASQP